MSDTGTSIPAPLASELSRSPDETASPAIRRSQSTLLPPPGISFETRGATALAPVIDIDRLWEAPPGTGSQMVTALELLKQACDLLAEARKTDNPIEADTYVQRLQLALPKLFACRAIGDGFGVVVNSLHFAFENLRGTPLTLEQVNVVWRVLRELRAGPAMSVEQGIQRAEELEENGLQVDPPDLGDLLENRESPENE